MVALLPKVYIREILNTIRKIPVKPNSLCFIFGETKTIMDLQILKSVAEDEHNSRLYFKSLREKHGVVCHRCGSKKHYWYEEIWQWKCTNCGKPQTLKSNTMLMHSKLPISTWFRAIIILNDSKENISTSSMMRKLDHKRYESIWFMMHKLRLAMGLTLVKLVDFNFFEVQSKMNFEIHLDKERRALKNKYFARVFAALQPENETAPQGNFSPILIESNFTYSWENELTNKDRTNLRSRYYLKRLNRHNSFKKVKCELIPNLSNSKAKECFNQLQFKLTMIHHGVTLRYLQKYLNEVSFHRIFHSVALFNYGMKFSLLNENWGYASG